MWNTAAHLRGSSGATRSSSRSHLWWERNTNTDASKASGFDWDMSSINIGLQYMAHMSKRKAILAGISSMTIAAPRGLAGALRGLQLG